MFGFKPLVVENGSLRGPFVSVSSLEYKVSIPWNKYVFPVLPGFWTSIACSLFRSISGYHVFGILLLDYLLLHSLSGAASNLNLTEILARAPSCGVSFACRGLPHH